MLIEKMLNFTEKRYGYIFFQSMYDNQLKEILKDKKKIKNQITIDVKIGDTTSYSCNLDLIRRRIYVGSAVKNIECSFVSVNITPELIEIKCQK